MFVPICAQQKRGEMCLALYGMDRAEPDIYGSIAVSEAKYIRFHIGRRIRTSRDQKSIAFGPIQKASSFRRIGSAGTKRNSNAGYTVPKGFPMLLLNSPSLHEKVHQERPIRCQRLDVLPQCFNDSTVSAQFAFQAAHIAHAMRKLN